MVNAAIENDASASNSSSANDSTAKNDFADLAVVGDFNGDKTAADGKDNTKNLIGLENSGEDTIEEEVAEEEDEDESDKQEEDEEDYEEEDFEEEESVEEEDYELEESVEEDEEENYEEEDEYGEYEEEDEHGGKENEDEEEQNVQKVEGGKEEEQEQELVQKNEEQEQESVQEKGEEQEQESVQKNEEQEQESVQEKGEEHEQETVEKSEEKSTQGAVVGKEENGNLNVEGHKDEKVETNFKQKTPRQITRKRKKTEGNGVLGKIDSLNEDDQKSVGKRKLVSGNSTLAAGDEKDMPENLEKSGKESVRTSLARTDKELGESSKKVANKSKDKSVFKKKKVVTKKEEKIESSRMKTAEETSAGKASNKVKSMGMIFMCSSKTKKDCYKYKVLGLPASKKEIVGKIYRGMRLFLYDFDLKLMYGIYKAAGPGGYNIVPKAFNSQFPSQVRFKILEDCAPLPEEKFRKVIKDNYYTRMKFDCQLNSEQVRKLCKLFSAANKSSSKRLARSPMARRRDGKRHAASTSRHVPYKRPVVRETRVRASPESSHARARPLPRPTRVPLHTHNNTRPREVVSYRHDSLLEYHDRYRRDSSLEHRKPLDEHLDPYMQDLRDPHRHDPSEVRRHAYRQDASEVPRDGYGWDHRDLYRQYPPPELDTHSSLDRFENHNTYRRDPLLERDVFYRQEPSVRDPLNRDAGILYRQDPVYLDHASRSGRLVYPSRQPQHGSTSAYSSYRL